MSRCYLACDLGAESGRLILGQLSEGRLCLEELHRFANAPVRIAGSLRWNLVGLFAEIKAGLRLAAARQLSIASLSVDSWGVDYVLLGAGQPMLSLPYHYRDARTDGLFAATRAAAGPEIFEQTGIQFMPINTLYQLLADVEQSPALLKVADHFLMIADYFHFLLSGVACVEESMASTTQLYRPLERIWSECLIERFAIPRHLFAPIVRSGTRLGPLTPALAAELEIAPMEIVATCSHDTGAAVAAVPALGNADDWAYLSSGTWSLLGVELPAPLINDEVRRANFTNEAGYGGTTRFLKNIIGMWLVQESRREWARQGQEIDYVSLGVQAEAAEPLRSLINPNAERFLKPDAMPAKIAAYCRETGQPEPKTPGEVTRCIYESLALLYRQTLQEIERLTGRDLRRLHIVGGGSQSALLNQCAANATGRTVMAGPVEATAIGNVLLQALTLGHLESLESLRATVADSFEVRAFHPADPEQWNQAYARFQRLPAA